MTSGIHHITAIASDAKENIRFYAQVLGLRLVKKTVNQDDVGTYHLFFGDREGRPGMDLTFFIFQPAMQGRRGHGLVTTISLAVPESALSFWEQRLRACQVKHEDVTERFGRKRIVFYDADDQQLEIVGVPWEEFETTQDPWTTADIPAAHAIRSFYAATLSVTSLSMIEPVLTRVFGYRHLSSDRGVHLFRIEGSSRACFIEVDEQPSAQQGFNAAGTVHHIAFRAKDEAEQMQLREQVVEAGLYPTTVIDRFYFKSVYFMTEAGILCEIATDGPGFTADESADTLGEKLALPPFLESKRTMIEDLLPKI